MLNTDSHNKQVKSKMTKADFIKNNRGIDNGKDLPQSLLESIFDEIQVNEIVLKEEIIQAKMKEKDVGIIEARQRMDSVQQYAATSESIALKTEALLNSLLGIPVNPDAVKFFSANHLEHVKPMFINVWAPILAGVSWPLQESNDLETFEVALAGLKYAINISCFFDLNVEKKAFISTLCKYAQFTDYNESKAARTLMAAKVLLDVAFTHGDLLGEYWKDVVECISALEKLQLTNRDGSTEFVEADARRASVDIKTQRKRPSPFSDVISSEANSQSITVAVDRIFNNSKNLSGAAIVDFIKYLAELSLKEISATSEREHPRMYCLQRLIELSFYNMNRIRVDWVKIWLILGEHFNQVGCHINSNVSFFALDKLRQLSQNFLDLEELSNFKFQKEFLKPFEETLSKNPDPKIKDMVLACMQQLLKAKSDRLKSGWKTIFAIFIKAAKEQFGI
jgi:brefeldin A-inhibited guanine nucleotide-exchange protein